MRINTFIKPTILTIGAAASIFMFSAHSSFAQETPTAYTLNAGDKSFNIEQVAVSEWKQKPKNNQKVYFLEPETNIDNYVLQQLGLKEVNKTATTNSNYNTAAIYKSLRTLESEINRETQNADLVIENNKVVKFNPGQSGVSLDVKSSIERISEDLAKNKTTTNLVVVETKPTKDLAKTNDLGITELVGSGSSDFRGSPRNRVHNITVGVETQRGILIAPGEVFSFNEFLGEVDGAHGFLPELVIKKTGTVPEFGGGLCQVSSTVFRAAMDGGFEIVERRNHSYAVQYYAPQGTDATIYPGVVDFRFKNDTGNHILIWPTLEAAQGKLKFDIYGTKDGRQVTLGTPYSYDKKANGAMKSVWTRKVVYADGTVKDNTFNSNYQPPALFHKVETFPSPQPATPAPTEPTTPTETPVNQS